MRKQSKLRNKITYVDNVRFASKKEARDYNDLKLQVKAKLISDLKLQPRFLRQEGFTYNGKKYRPIYYCADFSYIDNETKQLIVHETKGYRTTVYKIKEKLFLNKYPDIKFIVT